MIDIHIHVFQKIKIKINKKVPYDTNYKLDVLCGDKCLVFRIQDNTAGSYLEPY